MQISRCKPVTAARAKSSLRPKPLSRTLAESAKLGLKLQDSSSDRPRSPSECSTVSGGLRSRCDSDSSSGSEPPSPSRSQALLIFDWDDTLLPSTWFRAWRNRACGRGPLVDQDLRKHAKQVEAVLREARRLGPVAIVTLARENWLSNTARECLPGVDIHALFHELGIQVYYSREENCPGAWESGDFEALKRASMARCIKSWSSEGARASVLSIGDSAIERDALTSLLGDEPCGPLCKTLKMLEEPRISELTEQLKQLTSCLSSLVSGPRSCRISVDQSVHLAARVRAGI